MNFILINNSHQFYQIGTKSSKASIIANNDKIEIDPDTQSIPWTDIKSDLIDLHFPRERCKLLKNDDVIFLDSPGVDVEVNFDEWIDEYCADADLFIFVLNSESVCEESMDKYIVFELQPSFFAFFLDPYDEREILLPFGFTKNCQTQHFDPLQ